MTKTGLFHFIRNNRQGLIFKRIHKKNIMKRKILILLVSLLGFNYQSIAQADLMITPKRVVFEGNKSREELLLINLGKDTSTFSISFVQKKMKEDGGFETIEKPDSSLLIAEPFLRVFPRQVTLAPGEPQMIMLQCRRTANMEPGEYRSHLYFRSEKNYRPLGSIPALKDTNQVDIRLVPIYGMSIPVIIRTGKVQFSTSISDLLLETRQDTLQYLQVTINRTGNCSSYGNLIVEYTPEHGKPYQVGIAKSVGVYTNINKRNVFIRLEKVPGLILKSGRLNVRYTSPDFSKYVVYAEAVLPFTGQTGSGNLGANIDNKEMK